MTQIKQHGTNEREQRLHHVCAVSRVDIWQRDSGHRYKHRYQKRSANCFVISPAIHDATRAFEVTGFIAPYSRRADTVL
jgi:hypothetical protein